MSGRGAWRLGAELRELHAAGHVAGRHDADQLIAVEPSLAMTNSMTPAAMRKMANTRTPSAALVVSSSHKHCHVAPAENVAITSPSSTKPTGVDVVVDRVSRDTQCVGRFINRHACGPLCPVECA